MSFYLSAGVYTRELNLSNIVPTIATTTAALVGYSTKGDTTQIRLMTNTQQFIAEYGEPVLGTDFHYAALAFLETGNQLWCYRVQNGALYGGVKIKTSTDGTNAAIVDGVSSPDFVFISGEDNLFNIYGANAGAWNNDIGIQIIRTTVNDALYVFQIDVYFRDITGTFQKVESWTVSRKHQIDGFGRQQYLETVINGFSDYIVVADSTIDDATLPKQQTSTLAFAQGSDGSAIAESHLMAGWDKFANPDEVDIRIMIEPGFFSIAVQEKMKEVAESRKDCMAILNICLLYTSDAADE